MTCLAFCGGAHTQTQGCGRTNSCALANLPHSPHPHPRTQEGLPQSTFLPVLPSGSPTVGGFLPDTLQQACPSRQSTYCPMFPEPGREKRNFIHSVIGLGAQPGDVDRWGMVMAGMVTSGKGTGNNLHLPAEWADTTEAALHH